MSQVKAGDDGAADSKGRGKQGFDIGAAVRGVMMFPTGQALMNVKDPVYEFIVAASSCEAMLLNVLAASLALACHNLR